MWHSPGVQTRPHSITRRLRDPGARVLQVGVVLILLQLGFRAWAIHGSWFQFDDFAWLSIVTNADGPGFLLEGYGGHLMPAGFALTWLLRTSFAPLNFLPEASVLLALQAMASWGCLRLLRSMFGDRRFVLSCLALYLFSVITVPAFMWWAAGINQLPLQVALFFGLHAHLAYLRDRGRRDAVLAAAWLVFGLLFFEKSLLIGLVYGLIAFGWFCVGTASERLSHLWRHYRFGIVAYGALASGYLAIYLHYGLNFAPAAADETPLTPVAVNMVGKAFGTGVVGGPLRWSSAGTVGSIADPSQFVVLAAWALIALVVFRGAKSRSRSLRAWTLPVALLAANVLLVAAGRVSLVGSVVGLEYRYVTELAAVTAIALGLAFMPLAGADESAEPADNAPASDLERPGIVVLLTVFLCALGLYSSWLFVDAWHADTRSRDFFTSVASDLKDHPDPVPIVDLGLPLDIMWAYRYPENTYSHVLRVYDEQTSYPASAIDRIYVFDDTGRLAPAVLSQVRGAAAPSPAQAGCLATIRDGLGTIGLDGPVVGQGWWIRIAYFADESGVATMTLGDRTVHVQLPAGLHALYADAGSDTAYRDVDLTLPGQRDDVCVSEVTVGIPGAVPAS